MKTIQMRNGLFPFTAVAALCMALLPVPCRFLPGNHDIGDNVISGKMEKRVNDERRARFVNYFGEERWAFEQAGWSFIGLNSQLLGSDGQPAEAEQWKWLEGTMAALESRPIALFLHKPLFLDHPSEPDHEDLTLRQSCIDATSRARPSRCCSPTRSQARRGRSPARSGERPLRATGSSPRPLGIPSSNTRRSSPRIWRKWFDDMQTSSWVEPSFLSCLRCSRATTRSSSKTWSQTCSRSVKC